MKRACSLQAQIRMNIHMRAPSGLKNKFYIDEKINFLDVKSDIVF